ncbi:MAG: GAF domain-containing protein [Planctomycetes bacterium]|jgi:class 3 adenylate cyclase|nr:GAF domain-containing protein [Planctomycetota bacterium]
MARNQVVDLSESGRRRRALRRRRLRRILVPIGFVLLLIAALMVILVINHRASRREALALSDVVIRTTTQRIAAEVESYLRPAEQMARLSASKATELMDEPGEGAAPVYVGLSAEDGAPVLVEGPKPLNLHPLGIDVLRTYPQLAMYNIADPAGNFVMPKKMSDGAIDTKIIDRRVDPPQVRWVRRKPDGRVEGVEPMAYDQYDPRVRPWYRGAKEQAGLFWTDIYILFTDRKPGVTAAYPVIDASDDLLGVIGIDIELDALCTFLADLQIGRTGRAIIIDGQGRVVAHPDINKTMKEQGEGLVTVPVDELQDTPMTRVYNRSRIGGEGTYELEVDGVVYRGSATDLPATLGTGWRVLLVVPEKDFVGFVSERTRQTALMSLGVLAALVVFTSLVVGQGLRADRQAQQVLEREKQLQGQGAAFRELGNDPALLDPNDHASLQRLTRAASEATGVLRAGVWMIEGDTLVCLDAFDRTGANHVSGFELDLRCMPRFVQLLEQRELVAAADAAADERLRQFDELYLSPLHHESVLICPLVNRSGLAGALILEDNCVRAGWPTVTHSFVQSLAALLRARFDAGVSAPEAAEAAPADEVCEKETSESEPDAEAVPASSASEPTDAPIDRSAVTPLAVENRDEAAVLVIICESRHTTGGFGADDPVVLKQLHELSCLADAWSNDHPDARVIHGGDRVTVAAGIDASMPTNGEATSRLASLALRLQRATRASDTEDAVAVKMGLDVGEVGVAQLGRSGEGGQIVGPVLRIATQLAQRASGDAIQTSSRAFERLRSRFLLQRRGRFYAAGVGSLGTYFLAGELGEQA